MSRQDGSFKHPYDHILNFLTLNFHFWYWNTPKCIDRGVLTNFSEKVPFWGPYWPLNYFSHRPLNFSRQDASFKHPYDYILNHNFFDQKVAKLVETQKFCLDVLITHFSSGSSSFMYCPQLKFFRRQRWKNDCPTLVTTLEPPCTIFLPKDICYVKRPKLSENKKKMEQ